jgi:hypothetical protein
MNDLNFLQYPANQDCHSDPENPVDRLDLDCQEDLLDS